MMIRCSRCGNRLGELIGAYMAVRHKGRELVALNMLAITCEECGEVWTNERDGAGTAGLAKPDSQDWHSAGG